MGKLAAEYAPLPLTGGPFVSAQERELAMRARRRARRMWLIKRGAGAIAAIVAALFVVSVAFFRFPADEELASEAARVSQMILPLYTTSDQPLQIDRAVAVLSDTFDARALRYYIEVTLRLREPLFGPAATNGTVIYRLLQESVQRAREQEADLELFPLNDGPKPPELPRLIRVVHRAGEPLVVRLPLEARKFGWKWRLIPADLSRRTVNGRFTGAPLNHFNDAPYLIFGVPETMEDFRRRIDAARAYVTAVAKAAQLRGTSGHGPVPAATAPLPPPFVAPFAEDAPTIDLDRPAVSPSPGSISVPSLRRPFDPDKPAITPGKPPKRE